MSPPKTYSQLKAELEDKNKLLVDCLDFIRSLNSMKLFIFGEEKEHQAYCKLIARIKGQPSLTTSTGVHQ